MGMVVPMHVVAKFLLKLGARSVTALLSNPSFIRYSATLAAPQLIAFFVRQQLASLFPNAVGLDTAIVIVQKFLASPAGMLLAGTPALLLAPEGATIGAIYLLIIAASEGGAVVIKFSAKSTYDTLKAIFTGKEKKQDDSDWVLIPSPEPPAEICLLPGGVEFALALSEFTADAEPTQESAGIAQSVLYDHRAQISCPAFPQE